MTMVLLLALLVGLGVCGWLAWRFWGAGRSLFGSHGEARIGLSEMVSLDGKRKLLLIYRDGVEHLVMTGGPIDVVIEQGIQPQPQTHSRPSQVSSNAAVPAFEPRLSAQSATAQGSEAGPELQPGFGRLRQRAVQGQPPDAPSRAGPGALASGGGNR